MEEYKQTLKCVAEHGITQESLRNLWYIYLKFKAARPDWVEISSADARRWITTYAYLLPDFNEHDKTLVRRMSVSEKAKKDSLIWTGEFQDSLK
jgi:hypothetical protein